MVKLICIDERTFVKICECIRNLSDKIDEICNDDFRDVNWMSSRDVCTLLGISLRSLQNYRDTGKLGYSRIENKLYYKYDDVLRFINEFINNK